MAAIKNVPAIHFKGFEEEWEEKKLGEIGNFKNGMNFGKEAMGHGFPFVNLENIFGKNIVDSSNLGFAESSENQRKDYNLTKGDVLFIRSSVKPEGVGETAVIIDSLNNTTFSGFIIRFRPTINLNINFNRFVFSIDSSRKQILSNATSSANTNINQNSLRKIKVSLPIIEEQTQIGNYFKELENFIRLQEQKLEKVTNLKKAMLEKMFPKEGADVPEIRFKGFEEKWKRKKIEEVIDLKSGKDYKHLSPGNIPVYGTGGYMLSVNDALSYQENAIGIGRKGTIDKPFILYAPFWTVDTLFFAVPKQKNDLDFIYSVFQRITWKDKDESTGVPSLSKNSINNIEIFVVVSPVEQALIGRYFQKLDQYVIEYQQKIKQLKHLKQALLQKMFI